MDRPRIARHLGLDRATARRDLRRWLRQGLDGLADGKAPGAKPRWTEAMTAYLQELLFGDRAWTAPLLAEALEGRFFTRFHPGTVRRRLLALGYRWKRTRYVPVGKLGEGKRRLGYAVLPGGCRAGEVVYLPRYSPRYNPVETVWRRVKGWLLPRRYYGSVEELRRGVEEALRKLRERLEREVGQSLCMAT